MSLCLPARMQPRFESRLQNTNDDYDPLAYIKNWMYLGNYATIESGLAVSVNYTECEAFVLP